MTGWRTSTSLRRVATVLALVALSSAPGPALADEVRGSLDGLQVTGRQLDMVLTVPELDLGDVDSDSVSVEIGGQPVTVDVNLADDGAVARRVVLLVDVSGSMKGAGIEAAKSAAVAFLDVVPRDVEVGLVAFNDRASVLAEPTTDRAAVRRAVASLEPSRETALYDAVPVALDVLGTAGARTLVLLSDGGDTVSLGTRQTAVQALAASGARAEVVGFRTDESQDQVLADLAAAGSGRVAQVGDADELSAVFTRAAQALSGQMRLSTALPETAVGEQVVRVVADVGGDRVVATADVVLPDAPTVVAAADGGGVAPVPVLRTQRVQPPPLLSSAWPLALALGAFLFVCALLVSSPLLQSAGHRRVRQVEMYTLGGRRVRAHEAVRAAPSSAAQPFLDAAESFVQWRGLATGWALKLDRADMALRPHEWLVLRIAVALVAGALAAVLVGSWLMAVVVAVGGWLVTGLYVRVKASRRLAKFASQLPDALNLVASSISTGFSLPQALDAVSRDTADPMRVEIGRALAEARLGMDVEDALERTAYRMDNDDLRWSVMAIRVQRQVGGNLAETLRTTVATLRERSWLRRHVKALSAEGRLSAYILVALPIGLALWLYVSNRAYISLLWTNPLGWLMIIAGVVGIIVGSFWMAKVIKVEV